MGPMRLAASLLAGLALWTLLEYVLHRFVFHDGALGDALSRDHLRHHAEVDWFAPLQLRLGLAAVILPALAALSLALTGGPFAAGLLAGVVGGWIGYEVLHRRIHVAAPLNRYGRWARRHHLAHHFGSAGFNHGVTSPLWDLAFGTLRPARVVRVPRRHAAKFPWIAAGADQPWRADFELG